MSSKHDQIRNDPQCWIATAKQLIRALAVLRRGCVESNNIDQFAAEISAMMLAGFAFENAIKGFFLSQGGELYTKGELSNDFRSHTFVKWAGDLDIEFQGWEREALDKSEFFCVAWGRYPFHNNMSSERLNESCGWSDVEQVLNLTNRIIEKTSVA